MNLLAAISGGRFVSAPTNSWNFLGNVLFNDQQVIQLVKCILPLSSGGGIFWVGHTRPSGSSRFLAVYNESTRIWTTNPVGVFNREVLTIVEDSTFIYIGGEFTTIGGVGYNKIARWNKSTSTLSNMSTQGMNSRVNSLAVAGGMVYAIGDFSQAGGVTCSNVARWNGTSWSAMGTGLNSIGRTVAVIGTNVYVGGAFTTAGGVTCNRIAMWNGTAWSSLGTGLTGTTGPDCHIIRPSGNLIYVGGRFFSAGGVAVGHIAVYNTTTLQWSALGSGLSGSYTEVYSITITTDGRIIAAGQFTSVDGVAAVNIAIRTGTLWSPFSTGLTGGVYNVVYATAINNTNNALYAGGGFTTAGGKTVCDVARWSGAETI
jgi:hypothetical protein